MESVPQKRCSDCREDFPATTQFFHRNKNSKGGLLPRCKRCARIYHRNWDRVHRPTREKTGKYANTGKFIRIKQQTAKRCCICGIVKPLDQFYRESRRLDGHENRCKQCYNGSRRGNPHKTYQIGAIFRYAPGFVYLFKSGECYKIGMSVNPRKRIPYLKTGSAAPIEIVCTIKSNYMRLLERQLHEWFRHNRIAGEWFNLTSDDVQWITRLAHSH